MKKIILLSFIIGPLFFVNTTIVSACSCIQPLSPEESLKQATSVFVGKVINIDIPKKIFIESSDPIKITFEVSQIWKGPNYKIIILTTARDQASCGYPFEQNEEYIVYAYDKENKLNTNICSRTKLLTNAQEDLISLGSGVLPIDFDSNYIKQKYIFFSIILIDTGIIILIFILLILFTKKYKTKLKKQ
ncbi:MAG: hypothetical protein PHZ07_00145 [Patescibacteria group bacterium]|nr:hypothetical protein [Patescibacteria group bacterium]MDD4304144.1 hypothetical protein [Patescibacteria group bacterium]MDD4695175.1 hypothetical protein [Patescibacteria group bacterium]